MQEKTTFLMLSQIQPHFVYNTLTTIQVLCEIDPEKATETIDYFSKYLRMNTDALSKTTPVPVE
jgi:sensor histidine kinase YesM